jgi:ATP-dependent Clp protease ATP-binding subunit ClpB
VFNILLQVLDDGRLTDGQGRTVDFRNTVIVMTSNLGSHLIQEMGGKEDYSQIKSAVMELVGQHFRPEFINRIDDSVVFHALNKEQIANIASIQISYLQKRLQQQDITLTLNPKALAHLAEAGFDPVYGARPLKRTIQQQLENPLAQALLLGQFKPGESIAVSLEKERLLFKNA